MNRYKAILSYFELCQMVSPFEEGTCHLPIFLLCIPIVLLASKCLTYQLPTPGIDIHLRQTIPLTTKPKISTVSLSISNGLSKQCSLPKTLSLWSVGHLLKKIGAEAIKKKRQDPCLHSKELK